MATLLLFTLIVVAAVIWLGILVVTGFSLLSVAVGLLGVLAVTGEAR
jgi:hypothetical protein